jgi:hypothetical protein
VYSEPILAVLKQFLSSLTDGVASYIQGRRRYAGFWSYFLSIYILCIFVSRDVPEQIFITYDTRMFELEAYFRTVKLVLGPTVNLLQTSGFSGST